MKPFFKDAKIVGVNVPSEVYRRQDPQCPRGHPGHVMSRGSLQLLWQCASRWKDGFESEDTEATDHGNLLECMVLQPDQFNSLFIPAPETCLDKEGNTIPWDFKTKARREWKKEQEASGRRVVKPGDLQKAAKAHQAIHADLKAGALLAGASRQVMVIATYCDRDTGLEIPVKGLIDIVPDAQGRYRNELADFKTARDASIATWRSVVSKRWYHAQAAMYLDLFNAAQPQGERAGFLHLISENVAPFQVGRRLLTSETIDVGRNRYLFALQFYAKCLLYGQWPDYEVGQKNFDGWTPIEPTQWDQNQVTEEPSYEWEPEEPTAGVKSGPDQNDEDDQFPS